MAKFKVGDIVKVLLTINIAGNVLYGSAGEIKSILSDDTSRTSYEIAIFKKIKSDKKEVSITMFVGEDDIEKI